VKSLQRYSLMRPVFGELKRCKKSWWNQFKPIPRP